MDGATSTDGRLVAPFSLTDVVGAVAGIRRYQVVQDAIGRIRVRLEQAAMPETETTTAITAGIRDVVGADTQVEFEIAEKSGAAAR